MVVTTANPIGTRFHGMPAVIKNKEKKMNLYETKQVFENTYPPEAAEFCNQNGLMFVVLPSNGTTRRYQIQPVPEMTPEEKEKFVRDRRNELLKATDFTQSSDAPFDAETKKRYAAYRQYLRDIPKMNGFPNVAIQNYQEWQ